MNSGAWSAHAAAASCRASALIQAAYAAAGSSPAISSWWAPWRVSARRSRSRPARYAACRRVVIDPVPGGGDCRAPGQAAPPHPDPPTSPCERSPGRSAESSGVLDRHCLGQQAACPLLEDIRHEKSTKAALEPEAVAFLVLLGAVASLATWTDDADVSGTGAGVGHPRGHQDDGGIRHVAVGVRGGDAKAVIIVLATPSRSTCCSRSTARVRPLRRRRDRHRRPGLHPQALTAARW